MMASALLLTLVLGQTSQNGQILDFVATPDRVPLNGRARIVAQTADPLTGSDQLTVRVIRPDQVTDTLTVKPDKNGKLIWDYQPKMYGHYKLVFVGYDASTLLGNVQFEVTPWNVAAEHVARRHQNIRRHIFAISSHIDRDLQRRPNSANQNQALRDFKFIDETIKKLYKTTDKSLELLTQLQSFMQEYSAELPADANREYAIMLSDLSDWEKQAGETESQLKQIEERLRDMPSTCDQLEVAAEGLTFVSNVMIFVTTPQKIIVNLGLEKLFPAIDSAQGLPDNAKYRKGELRKDMTAVALDGPEGLIGRLLGATGDLAAFMLQKLFTETCRVIEGPVKSTFTFDAKHQNKVYWRYHVTLEGKLRLWSEKSAPVTPNGLEFSGRLEGNFTKVDFWEEIFVIENYPVGGQMLLRKKITPPVGTLASQDQIGLGQIARAAVPGYFNARYLANLKDDTLSIRQESIVTDISDLYRNRLAIAFIPPGGLVPVFRVFHFPIQKGSWIIDRTTRGAFSIPATQQGETSIFRQTFTREDVTPSGDVSVTFKTSYDLK